MTVSVREANDRDKAGWDAFVADHPDATFFHNYDWRHVVEKGAGHKCIYLIAEKAGEVFGVLPLTIRNSLLFGKAVTSSMFAVYGGPLAYDQAHYDTLDAAATDIAKRMGIDVIEYRNQRARHDGEQYAAAGWQIDRGKSATFVKPIVTDKEQRMLAIPRKQRAVVRKALSAGLTLEETNDLDVFYALYASSVHRLGTPVFPKKLFEVILDIFGTSSEMLIVRNNENTAIASLLNFYGRNSVLPYYAGSAEGHRTFGAHDFMYWHTMERALERGKTLFDFGRSKIDSGPYKFKKNWGFEPTPLEYEYLLLGDAKLPDLSAGNSKYGLMSNLWKKLPLGLANLIGPYISRHLG
ncbi:FemAB family XrtA/PEP-CTERM system-associated protein [Kordiimonas sp. SCSIO 12610]|uniref:FemAB family XrtA/PEP-CTERM system-associated protein n=1 Tax=Kordiimonas sp. SCSIO 12610 TaxID=2829597 RepID=UPI0021089466|nr:FemAB family XrtA/PEP-CTERM system-associated protein [Kordiimonas sp. SCSIO 12610]UTW54151.1 FemAB family PEP-CTERM system-associated protein [Kordiimonas sp. SCSIO 12610]